MHFDISKQQEPIRPSWIFKSVRFLADQYYRLFLKTFNEHHTRRTSSMFILHVKLHNYRASGCLMRLINVAGCSVVRFRTIISTAYLNFSIAVRRTLANVRTRPFAKLWFIGAWENCTYFIVSLNILRWIACNDSRKEKSFFSLSLSLSL